MEYFFWRFEKHIALSEKKPPLPSLLPLLGMPATDRCYQLNEDGFMLFAQMRKKRFSASSVVYNNTIWITGVKEFLVLALFGHCAFRHLCSFYMFFYILISIKNIYRIVASTNTCYYSENQLFVKRSQYIRTENPLHKQSEKAKTCH